MKIGFATVVHAYDQIMLKGHIHTTLPIIPFVLTQTTRMQTAIKVSVTQATRL